MSALGTEARIDVEWQAWTLQGYVGSKPENPNSGARAESVVWLSETLQADPGPQSLPKPLSGCERRKICWSCTRWRGFNQIYTHIYIYISLAGERTAAERLWKQNFATARRKQWEILGVGISPNPKRGAGNDDSSEDFRGWEVLNFVLQSDETRSSDIDPNSTKRCSRQNPTKSNSQNQCACQQALGPRLHNSWVRGGLTNLQPERECWVWGLETPNLC